MEPFYKLPSYYDLFVKAGAKSIQLWETIYFQAMSDYRKIFDWVKGTGLRSVLSVMDAVDQKNFTDTYVEAISKEYSMPTNNKILLPFQRIFLVAYK